jgi:CRP/FNR family cyclic AMP-dependent transcriptional regulator
MSKVSESRLRRSDGEKRAILREHFLFSKLSEPQIERLSSCILSKLVRQGNTIFLKGDPGSSVFAIRKGRVKISVPSVEGHDVVFNLLHEGDIFGEIALLDGRPRTADAIAITDCEFFTVERRDFLPLVYEEPEIAIQLIEILCLRLRRLSEQTEYVMFHTLASRLAKTLLQLAASAADMNQIKVDVTQQDLADMIGMTRESTNKQLQDWGRKKWVRLSRGCIMILSAAELARIAESDSSAG